VFVRVLTNSIVLLAVPLIRFFVACVNRRSQSVVVAVVVMCSVDSCKSLLCDLDLPSVSLNFWVGWLSVRENRHRTVIKNRMEDASLCLSLEE
jgi:hypothetical protein